MKYFSLFFFTKIVKPFQRTLCVLPALNFGLFLYSPYSPIFEPFSQNSTDSFPKTFIHSFIRSFIHLFIHLFIYLFIYFSCERLEKK